MVYNQAMKKEVEAQKPKIELATKDWTLKELMDTERRIEKAFHEQTQFLSQKTDGIERAFQEQTLFMSQKSDDLKREINTQTRWMMGLFLTMTIAIIVAVLFQG